MTLQPAAFRAMALALPEAVEGAHHGHADFRVGGRVFASLWPDGERAMLVLPPATQRRLLAGGEPAFTAANGAWGKAGCTILTLATADRGVVRDLLLEALQAAVAKGPTRPTLHGPAAAKPPRSRRPRQPRRDG